MKTKFVCAKCRGPLADIQPTFGKPEGKCEKCGCWMSILQVPDEPPAPPVDQETQTLAFVREYTRYLRELWEGLGFQDSAGLLLTPEGNMLGVFCPGPPKATSVEPGHWIILKTGPLLKSTGLAFVEIPEQPPTL